MVKRIAMCSLCNSEIVIDGEPGQKIDIKCSNCNGDDLVTLTKKEIPLEKTGLKELEIGRAHV